MSMKKNKPSVILILILILICYFSLEILITSYYYFQAKIKQNQLLNEIAKTESENESLAQKIKILNSEDYIEKYARENLMLAKEGETIILFKENEENKQASSEEESNTVKKYLSKLLKLFQK